MTRYVGPKSDSENVATQGDLSGGGGPPAGTLMPFAGSTAPSGYLVCDGSAVSRTTYAALFAVIGTTYGAGNGSTTFGLPNLKGRVVVGVDSSQGEFDTLGETGGAKTVTLATTEIPSHSHGNGTLATNTAGSHTHTVGNESGQHSHTYDRSTISVNTGSNFVRTGGGSAVTSVSLTNTGTATSLATLKVTSDGSHSHDVTGSTGNSGGGESHNNLSPYMALTYLIKT